MRLTSPIKRRAVPVLLALGILSAAFFAVSLLRTVQIVPYVGLRIAAEQGQLKVHAFDPLVWPMRYARGLTFWPRDAAMQWAPAVHTESGEGLNVKVEVPLWLLAGLFAGAWRGAKAMGWHRQDWQCRACGYDVRGLKGGLCTECGRPIGAVSAS